jgi:Mitochondrial sulfhydryl oxidase involved in the biogenesis of cytosolic Fe/S proteins
MSFTNSTIWGPGVWFTLHLLSITSTNQNETIKQIKFILSNLPCEVCKEHAAAYLSRYPIEDYKDTSYNKDKNGLFVWTYRFHNAVNYRLGKKQLDWDVAYNLYLPFKK